MVQLEHDTEVEDDLSRSTFPLILDEVNCVAQKALRELKGKISAQSKKNFVLERDVRYLDSRIALLIQNRMALDEQNEFAARIEDAMDTKVGQFPDDRKVQVSPFCFIKLTFSNTEICFTCCKPSHDTSQHYVD